MRFQKPSPSMVVASIALFVSLGGTSVAAVSYARNAGKVDGYDAVRASSSTNKAAGNLVAAPGHEARGEDIELLFVDSSHDRDATVAELRAWQPRLAPGALVVLHDYGNPAYPGVGEAVTELGLSGREHAGLWLWEAPA